MADKPAVSHSVFFCVVIATFWTELPWLSIGNSRLVAIGSNLWMNVRFVRGFHVRTSTETRTHPIYRCGDEHEACTGGGEKSE